MFAGPFAMIFYGVQIFQETGKYKTHISKFQSKGLLHKLSAGVNAHMAAVVVAILRVVGGLVALVLIKKLPRYFRLSSSLLETWQCDRNTKNDNRELRSLDPLHFRQFRVRLAMATMTLMSLSMAILGAVLYLKDKGAEGSTLLRW